MLLFVTHTNIFACVVLEKCLYSRKRGKNKLCKAMAYDRLKIFEQAKSVAVSEGLLTIDDVVGLLPCTKGTFYEWFPAGSDESEALKEILDANKVGTKATLRKAWKISESATLQIALYKLCATREERAALSNVDITVTDSQKLVFDWGVNPYENDGKD